MEENGNKLHFNIDSMELGRNKKSLVVKMSTFKQLDTAKKVTFFNTTLFDASQEQKNDVYYLNKFHTLDISNPSLEIHLIK